MDTRVAQAADRIEAWLRSNGSLYLTTARHAVLWPADATSREFSDAMTHLVATGRVVEVASGTCGLSYRVPNVWPEWVERLTGTLDLSTRITIGRCKAADGQAVAS